MKPLTYAEAYDIASKLDSTLKAADFDIDGFILLLHEDGTLLLYRSAFISEYENWIFCFTEHHGFHIYDKSDLLEYVTVNSNNIIEVMKYLLNKLLVRSKS